MEKSTAKNTSKKQSSSKSIILWILALVIINVLAYRVWWQLDLTQDKRYSIHPKTAHMLRQLQSTTTIQLFLTGDKLPSGFKKLASNTEELIRNFRAISNNKIAYNIVDLTQADTSYLNQLAQYGISNFPVTVAEGKGKTTQIPVTPFVLVENGDKKMPVLLQSFKTAQLTENDFNNSLVLLEYNIANAIKKVNQSHLDSVLYLLGNAESGGYEVYQLANTLSGQYIFHVDTLQHLGAIPLQYKTVIVNQPKTAFSEMDKYKLDQYLMKGGNLMYCLKTTTASFDSLKVHAAFTAIPLETSLQSLLFSYGVRIGPNLVSDLEKCVYIPLQNEDNRADQSQFFLWPYFPIFYCNPDHPITKNLSEVLGKFPSEIELVNHQAGIEKTPLLYTSNYARVESVPLQIDITAAMLQPNPSLYNKKKITTGALISGQFSSIYANNLPTELSALAGQTILKSQKPAKIAVFSDGDIFNNDVSQQSGPKEMGTYLYSPFVFSNKSLLLNTMEYLTDDEPLLEVRAKTYQASLLDKKRKEAETLKWQIINIGVPALLVIIAGLLFYYLRKKKYEGHF